MVEGQGEDEGASEVKRQILIRLLSTDSLGDMFTMQEVSDAVKAEGGMFELSGFGSDRPRPTTILCTL